MNTVMEAEESLLYSSRHGEIAVVKGLLEAKKDGKLTLNVNCKGKSKTNLGWTPLQLATYFGHKDAEALLEAAADVDEVNKNRGTALHKASFIGNEDLVILLLNHNADVNIMNSEGKTPCDVSKTQDVQRLLEAAERAMRYERERRLLTAAKEGLNDELQELLSSSNPANINCVDAQGKWRLVPALPYCCVLLQNGIDTTLRSNSGRLAINLAKDGGDERSTQHEAGSEAAADSFQVRRALAQETQVPWMEICLGDAPTRCAVVLREWG